MNGPEATIATREKSGIERELDMLRDAIAGNGELAQQLEQRLQVTLRAASPVAPNSPEQDCSSSEFGGFLRDMTNAVKATNEQLCSISERIDL